ncbi:alkaline phosphatase D family protein [soil metagenome]
MRRMPSFGGVSRRRFLAGLAATAAVGACISDGRTDGGDGAGPATTASITVPPDLPPGLFAVGVASGDPRPDSVILWTRLAPEPTAGGGMPPVDVPVEWEVAADGDFEDVVASGTAVATPELAHSVHVDSGGLEPATAYRYRFKVGDQISAVGTTRTAPGDEDGPERLRFAFASCQHFEQGYYTAHRALAAEDLDLVVFLGDYIYEGGPADPGLGHPRRHTTPEPVDLAGYRNRYGEYKADPDLQAAHAAFAWVCTWDDHEVEDNYAGAVGGSSGVGTGPDAFLRRRAAAYQAYYEHQPLRLDPPDGPDYAIHRTQRWGGLARFFVLDTRQYRSDQVCGPLGAGPVCPEVDDPARTMLGAAQEEWLDAELAATEAAWNVVAQQVVLSQVAVPIGDQLAVSFEAWDGYRAARQRLLDRLAGGVPNPVVISGDVHASAAGNLHADASDPSTPVVAAELVTTSISSATDPGWIALVETARATSPAARYADARRRGYVVCDVTPQRWRADFRYVSTALEPTAEVTTGATCALVAGAAGLQPG